MEKIAQNHDGITTYLQILSVLLKYEYKNVTNLIVFELRK